jgi:hypothetical protein
MLLLALVDAWQLMFWRNSTGELNARSLNLPRNIWTWLPKSSHNIANVLEESPACDSLLIISIIIRRVPIALSSQRSLFSCVDTVVGPASVIVMMTKAL